MGIQNIMKNFDDDYWLECDQKSIFPHKFYDEIADGGWLGICMPKEFGGSALGITEASILMQKVSETGGGMAAASSIHINIFGPHPIVVYGNQKQKSKWLPSLITGKEKTCFGVTEPDAGLDTGKLKTFARKINNGYLINGQKIWTTTAQIADKILLLARTTPFEECKKNTDGLTLFYTKLDRKKIEVKEIPKMGRSAVDSNQIFIDNLEVEDFDRIGEEGKGWTYAKGLLEHERTGLAGLSKSLVELEQLKDNARSIQRGNGNLMDDSSYKSKIGELEIDLLATEFTELRSLASAAAGGEPGPESSILKLKGTEIKQRIQKLTVEASGIYSSAWGDKGVGPAFAKGGTAGYLNSRYFTIYGGASEVQKDIVAKKVLGLTKGSSK